MVSLLRTQISHCANCASCKLTSTALLQRRHLPGLCGLLRAGTGGHMSSSHLQAPYPAAAFTGVQQNGVHALPASRNSSAPQPILHPTAPASLAQAFKKRWEEAQQKKQLRTPWMPGWLANLTMLGVGAAVVAANVEQTPITGRRRFIMSSNPTIFCSESGRLPQTAEFLHDDTQSQEGARVTADANCQTAAKLQPLESTALRLQMPAFRHVFVSSHSASFCSTIHATCVQISACTAVSSPHIRPLCWVHLLVRSCSIR